MQQRSTALSVCAALVCASGTTFGQDGTTTRVSITPAGEESNGSVCASSAISHDGRFVAFWSSASNLVGSDLLFHTDVFVHDRNTGINTRVSVAVDGSEGDGNSMQSSISADGVLVAFESDANNLVAGDTGMRDVFLHDRSTGITRRVSQTPSGEPGNWHSEEPALSADGRFVAFSSAAQNFVDGDSAFSWDIFVHEVATGQKTMVSVNSQGVRGNGASLSPAISGDGRYVAFMSDADNLVSDDTNNTLDIFVHDRVTGETTRVSVDSNGVGGSSFLDTSYYPAISADGCCVAFASRSDELVSDDTNMATDVFVHDRLTGETTRVSVDSQGEEGSGVSGMPYKYGNFISADGSLVVFASVNAFVADDTNSVRDVYLHDRVTGQTSRVSLNSAEVGGNGESIEPVLSGDGRFVAFSSTATNLVPGDTNDKPDVFVRERYTCGAQVYCPLSQNSAGMGSTLAHTGSLSIAANDFGLLSSGNPPVQFGIFFMGPNATQIPYGNGYLCVNGSLTRYPILATDAAGNASYQVNNTTAPALGKLRPGAKWNWQFWYRDPMGGGAFKNFSQALEVIYCP